MRDGSVVVQQSDADGKYRDRRITLTQPGTTDLLIPTDGGQTAASPDGRFISFVSERSGAPEVYVRPIDVKAAPDKISAGGGTAAAWSKTKQELLYLREPEIVAVPYTLDNGGRIRFGAERVWSRVTGDYAAGRLITAKDGRVLVAVDRAQTRKEIRVIVNWARELAGKVK